MMIQQRKTISIISTAFLFVMALVALFSIQTVQAAGGDCEIPASGPWPACATGGAATASPPAAQASNSASSCVIPERGPWPPCATASGAQTAAPAPAAPAAAPNTTAGASVTSETKWQGEYFSTYWFVGLPAMTRQDDAIAFDWGQGSPDPKVPVDNFSVKWRKEITLNAPTTYKFTASADNFLKLYINTELVLDVDVHDGVVSAEYQLRQGKNWVYVEYKEQTWASNVSLTYAPVGTVAPQPTPESTSVWQPQPTATPSPTPQPAEPEANIVSSWAAEYYNNPNLAGEPVLRRNETGIDFDWAYAAPISSVPIDNFSVRWQRTFVVKTPSIYRIEAQSSDRVRLLFNGKPFATTEGNVSSTRVSDRGSTTHYLLMRPGQHTIQVELFDLVSSPNNQFQRYSSVTVSTRAEQTNLDISGLNYSMRIARESYTQTGFKLGVNFNVNGARYPRVMATTYPNPSNNSGSYSNNGSYNFHVGSCDYKQIYFNLMARVGNTTAIIATQVMENQPHDWFVNPANGNTAIGSPCAPAAQLQASSQRFQHGRMIWVDSGNDNSNDRIIVLLDDLSVYDFTDYFNSSRDAVRDPALNPPSGLIQPEYGFGKIWRENLKVRSDLGWAIEQPVNYTAQYQRSNHYFADYRNTGTVKYFSLPDGQVIELVNTRNRLANGSSATINSWRVIGMIR